MRWQPQAGTNAGTSDTELSSTMNSESNARVNAEGQSLLNGLRENSWLGFLKGHGFPAVP
jgi:hypothetical protein